MANRYSQNFTLLDIFNNKALQKKLPLVNYKERETEEGKISYRTNVKSINRQVFDTAEQAARPFFKPLVTRRRGDYMLITGEPVDTRGDAVNAVYRALVDKKQMLVWTANNMSMVRSAIKEAEKNRRNYGNPSKLYLRTQSMRNIEGMSRKQVLGLMSDIMQNIFYGDDFPATQKKYSVKDIDIGATATYEQRRLAWKQKVGDL